MAEGCSFFSSFSSGGRVGVSVGCRFSRGSFVYVVFARGTGI